MARQRLRRICRVQLQRRACMRSTEIGPSPGVCFRNGTPPKQLVLHAIAHTQGALLCSVIQVELPPAPYSTLLFPWKKMPGPPYNPPYNPSYNPSYASSDRHARLCLPLLTASAHLSCQSSFLQEPCKSSCNVDYSGACFHQLSFVSKYIPVTGSSIS